jgi:allantoicase
MRSERAEAERRRRETNAVEVIVVTSVVAGFIAFEIWFVFFAGQWPPRV